MAEEKPGGAAPAARKQWDKSEWEAKAKAKDAEYAERAKEAEAAMQSGKRPQFKPKDDLPKPTKALEQRKEDLGIEKNLNKTMLVQTTATGKGPRGAGFYCELCNRTLKDSLSYLDHVNGKDHLRQLGQTIHVSRSTVSQVRARIAQLRAETATKVTAKNFDFQARLSDIRKNSNDEKVRRKEEKKRKRLERKEEEEMARMGVIKKSKVDADEPAPEATSRDKGRDKKKRVEKEDRENEEESKQVEQAQQQYQDMAAMMGFGGFSAKKK